VPDHEDGLEREEQAVRDRSGVCVGICVVRFIAAVDDEGRGVVSWVGV
jgi:hypothetical protein